jgi:hypothetical protein
MKRNKLRERRRLRQLSEFQEMIRLRKPSPRIALLALRYAEASKECMARRYWVSRAIGQLESLRPAFRSIYGWPDLDALKQQVLRAVASVNDEAMYVVDDEAMP